MIIGKSLTALGGGLKPEIRVTAKAGALLNLHYKDSTIILKSYQLGADETMHTFSVNVSETAYVVEDVTNGKSVEVLVDVVALFDAKIPYALYLYNEGDECTDITGGWTGDKAGAGIWTKTNTSWIIKTETSYGGYGISSNNAIDVTGYSEIHVELSDVTYSNCAPICTFYLDGYSASQYCAGFDRPSTSGTGTLKAENVKVGDISGLNVLKKFVSNVATGGANSTSRIYAEIYKIWLE